MLQENKNIITSALFVIICLSIYVFFPATGNFQQIIAALVFLVLLPLLYNKLILKKSFHFYHIWIGDWRKGLIWGAIGLLTASFIMFLLIRYTSFLGGYELPVSVRGDFGTFLFYELVIVTFFSAIYEFFFRGFVLFHCLPYLGRWSVVAQFALFAALLYLTGSLVWPFVPYLVFAIPAGWITYKSNSIVYSLVGQIVLIICVDTAVIKLLS